MLLTLLYQTSPGGGCVALASLPPDTDFVATDGKMAAAEFVAFVPLSEGGSASVMTRWIVGDDGSRIAYMEQLYDVNRKKTCGPTMTVDGALRCAPLSAFGGFEYGDPACATRVTPDSKCRPIGIDFDDSVATYSEGATAACSSAKTHVALLGAKRAISNTWQKNGAACSGPTSNPTDLFDIGPDLDPAAFPELGNTTSPGTRIVEDVVMSSGAIVAWSSVVHDRTLDVRCTFGVAADGQLRCIPVGLGTPWWADDQCTVPYAALEDACATPKYAIVGETVACTPKTRVYTLGTKKPFLGTDVWQGKSGACTKFMGGASTVGLYTLGAEVPPSSLAATTLVHR